MYTRIHTHSYTILGAHSVMVVVIDNRHGNLSSNPGRGCYILHSTYPGERYESNSRANWTL